MTSSQVRDQDLDRPQVQAQRCVQPSGTNRACGLAYCIQFKHDFTRRQDASVFGSVAVLFNPQGFPAFAGGHRGAEIPVPIPNTAVKRPFAEGSVGPAHARVGRRRLFFLYGALHSLVVRLLWEQNVGGSNPLAPTIKSAFYPQ